MPFNPLRFMANFLEEKSRVRRVEKEIAEEEER
jgi:hypothetical protein